MASAGSLGMPDTRYRRAGSQDRRFLVRAGLCGVDVPADYLRNVSTCAAKASGWSSMMKWNELSMRTMVLFGRGAKLSLKIHDSPQRHRGHREISRIDECRLRTL